MSGNIEILLDSSTIILRKDEILLVSPFKGATIGPKEAKKILDTIDQLSQYTKRAIIFDSRMASVNMEARVMLTNEQAAKSKHSMALLVPNLSIKVLANLSYFINRPTYPMRAFLTEKAALIWSHKHLQRENFELMYSSAA
ncbi:MAG: hypothetical protein SFW35_02030 [Chitinophagales bacterium]|nr:hypothetical protein [Chitinophagales bacterium]